MVFGAKWIVGDIVVFVVLSDNLEGLQRNSLEWPENIGVGSDVDLFLTARGDGISNGRKHG